MSDEEVKFGVADEVTGATEGSPAALPEDEPVSVVVEPIVHGEAAQRAANKMPHSERTVNGGKRL